MATAASRCAAERSTWVEISSIVCISDWAEVARAVDWSTVAAAAADKVSAVPFSSVDATDTVSTTPFTSFSN